VERANEETAAAQKSGKLFQRIAKESSDEVLRLGESMEKLQQRLERVLGQKEILKVEVDRLEQERVAEARLHTSPTVERSARGHAGTSAQARPPPTTPAGADSGGGRAWTPAVLGISSASKGASVPELSPGAKAIKAVNAAADRVRLARAAQKKSASSAAAEKKRSDAAAEAVAIKQYADRQQAFKMRQMKEARAAERKVQDVADGEAEAERRQHVAREGKKAKEGVAKTRETSAQAKEVTRSVGARKQGYSDGAAVQGWVPATPAAKGPTRATLRDRPVAVTPFAPRRDVSGTSRVATGAPSLSMPFGRASEAPAVSQAPAPPAAPTQTSRADPQGAARGTAKSPPQTPAFRRRAGAGAAGGNGSAGEGARDTEKRAQDSSREAMGEDLGAGAPPAVLSTGGIPAETQVEALQRILEESAALEMEEEGGEALVEMGGVLDADSVTFFSSSAEGFFLCSLTARVRANRLLRVP